MNNLSIRKKENPIKNILKLDINEAVEIGFNYEIVSLDGKIILSGQLQTNHSINVETLDAAMYFLRVFDNESHRQTLKFVKQ